MISDFLHIDGIDYPNQYVITIRELLPIIPMESALIGEVIPGLLIRAEIIATVVDGGRVALNGQFNIAAKTKECCDEAFLRLTALLEDVRKEAMLLNRTEEVLEWWCGAIKLFVVHKNNAEQAVEGKTPQRERNVTVRAYAPQNP